jgi:hypothetical protein
MTTSNLGIHCRYKNTISVLDKISEIPSKEKEHKA